jgi:dTDP-4-dehydrorhamnose 3,5-epimerase
MKKIATKFPDVWVIEPQVFRDNRGFFFESYSYEKFRQLGIDITFVQDNHSKSAKNTVRGLHFSVYPGQVKLVRCIKGMIWDVVVDIRPSSPNFMKWDGFELSDVNCLQIFIPIGYAHGFSVLSEDAEVLYKVSNYYDPKLEQGILWNDTSIGVDWKVKEPILSKRDQNNLNILDLLKKAIL